MKRIVIGLALLALMLAPAMALAQTEEPETQRFTSSDEQLTLDYPTTWAAEELPAEAGLPGVQLADSPATMERLLTGGTLEAGEQGVVMMLLPTEFLAFAGITVPENPTAADLTVALARSFTGAEPAGLETEEPPMAGATAEALPGGTSLGPVETVELGSGLEVGYVTYGDEFSEGVIVAYELKEGLTAVLIAVALPGSYSAEFDTQVLDLVDTIAYSGTAEDLMNALLGFGAEGAAPDGTAPDAGIPEGTPEAVG